jgi:hypothetical protein
MYTARSLSAALLRKQLFTIALLFTVACGESDSDPKDDTSHPATTTGEEDAGDHDVSSGDSGVSSEGPEDAATPLPEPQEDASTGPSPTAMYNQDGCLTYASASALCGFSSNGDACKRYESCGRGTASECQINCEMYTSFTCVERDFVDTCLAAVEKDCDALSVCQGWFY